MKAGFFATDITPAVGMEQPGDYRKSYVARIHDPLKARAAVFEHDGAALALVGIDTCILGSRQSVARIRREIERRCGIPAGSVLLAASHTHSGGPLWQTEFGDLTAAPELVQRLATEFSIACDPLYAGWVEAQCVTAVCEAWNRREEARLSLGRGREEQAAHNRRFRMANGRVYTHPGRGNPDIVEPAGPTDPEVGVVGAWTPGGDLLGCVVNFACHATTFGGGVSADWVGWLERTVQGAMRTAAPVVFLNGACGDVTQVDNRARREPEFGEKWSRFVGARVGAEAVKSLVSAGPEEHAPLAATSRTLRLSRRAPNPESVEQSRALVEEGLRTGQRDTAWTFAKERIVLDWMARLAPEAEVEVQALQVGRAVFLASPAELFCALGLEIKRESPFPFTFVVELANGCVGYVPPPEAFAPDGGGYETVLTTYSNLEVQAGSRIVAASLDLGRSLAPGLPPESPPAWTPGEPWSYGVLGPDLD